MILERENTVTSWSGIPRESGDDPAIATLKPAYVMYSPRERG